MPVEMKGNQLRIRVRDPRLFTMFRTDDVGGKGKLSRIAGHNDSGWTTQSWRLNLSDYDDYSQFYTDLFGIKGLSAKQRTDALRLGRKYFGGRR